MSTLAPAPPPLPAPSLGRRPRPRSGGGRWSVTQRALLRTPGRVAGVVIVLGFAVMGVIGPWLYPPNLPVDAGAIYAGPSLAHPLGTDFEGTDVLALLVTGARYVLVSALIAGLVAVVVGTAIGLVAGYRRGIADLGLSRFTDFVLTVPGIPLLVVLSTIYRFTSPYIMGAVLGFTGWGGLARAVRSQALSLRERPFLESSRALGLPVRHIVFRELLPNVAPYVAMNLLLAVIGSIYAETGLFFLGVLPAAVNNWGVMLNLAVFSAGAIGSQQALTYLLAPLVAILLLTLGIVLVLDAVDEIFNPRLRTA